MKLRETLKDCNCQYVKSLGCGEHLIYDYETDRLEVWANSKYYCCATMTWNNTELEFCRTYDNQAFQFIYRLNELILGEMLPHGSGIDYDWQIEDKGKYFNCHNGFHCMNENGYYDGIAEFTIIIPKKNIMDFKLHFNGNQSQWKNRQYLLRDYLEDTFHYALSEIGHKLKSLGIFRKVLPHNL